MSEAMDAPVLFDTLQTASGHAFGRATLNTPAVLNALSLAMIDLLDPQLAAWAEDPRIAGVVLDAVGDRAFCAGGDVVRVYRAIRAAEPGQVPQEALVAERDAFLTLFDTEDQREGVAAFLEKRPPRWRNR